MAHVRICIHQSRLCLRPVDVPGKPVFHSLGLLCIKNGHLRGIAASTHTTRDYYGPLQASRGLLRSTGCYSVGSFANIAIWKFPKIRGPNI